MNEQLANLVDGPKDIKKVPLDTISVGDQLKGFLTCLLFNQDKNGCQCIEYLILTTTDEVEFAVGCNKPLVDKINAAAIEKDNEITLTYDGLVDEVHTWSVVKGTGERKGLVDETIPGF